MKCDVLNDDFWRVIHHIRRSLARSFNEHCGLYYILNLYYMV